MRLTKLNPGLTHTRRPVKLAEQVMKKIIKATMSAKTKKALKTESVGWLLISFS